MSHPSFWHVIGANDCIVQPVAQSPQSHMYCDIAAAATVNPAAAATLPDCCCCCFLARLLLIEKRKIEESVIVLFHHAIRDSSAANRNRESFNRRQRYGFVSGISI